MSSSNTSTADVDRINWSSKMFIQVVSYLFICLGTIGHSLNMYVFTRPILRSNPCSRYFLAATLTGFFVTYVNVPLRLIQNVSTHDLFALSSASCKMLTYVLFWARAQTSWFIALACVDRFLCSSRSAGMRSWSNLRVASRTILFMISIVGLFYIYVPIEFQLKPPQMKCPANQGNNPTFVGIWNLLVFSVGPSAVMLIFGSLTIRHVQQSVKRVLPGNTNTLTQGQPPLQEQQPRRKIPDRQLIQMMIVQCAYFSLMSTPISINWIYLAVRPTVIPTALQNATDNFVANIVSTLALAGACTSFYLFTLSSQLFRRELMCLCNGRHQLNQDSTLNAIRSTGRN